MHLAYIALATTGSVSRDTKTIQALKLSIRLLQTALLPFSQIGQKLDTFHLALHALICLRAGRCWAECIQSDTSAESGANTAELIREVFMKVGRKRLSLWELENRVSSNPLHQTKTEEERWLETWGRRVKQLADKPDLCRRCTRFYHSIAECSPLIDQGVLSHIL